MIHFFSSIQFMVILDLWRSKFWTFKGLHGITTEWALAVRVVYSPLYHRETSAVLSELMNQIANFSPKQICQANQFIQIVNRNAPVETS